MQPVQHSYPMKKWDDGEFLGQILCSKAVLMHKFDERSKIVTGFLYSHKLNKG